MPQIDTETLNALEGLAFNPQGVAIVRQLDRKLYTKVNKVLEAAGGKWDRRAKCHVFADDPEAVIEQIMLTGEYRIEKQDFGVFYTPPRLAEMAARACDIRPGHAVLEPEIGMGALALAAIRLAEPSLIHIRGFDVLESHATHINGLKVLGLSAERRDFLMTNPEHWPLFDRVLMNPPFAKQADAQHLMHALKFLKPSGARLVAIMSAGVTFRETDWYRRVRALATAIKPLPPGSFKESGTSVNAVLVTIDRK